MNYEIQSYINAYTYIIIDLLMLLQLSFNLSSFIMEMPNCLREKKIFMSTIRMFAMLFSIVIFWHFFQW
jgi:hypothetical protein